jgi:NADP oxidoreductase coenzyme F420-dependent
MPAFFVGRSRCGHVGRRLASRVLFTQVTGLSVSCGTFRNSSTAGGVAVCVTTIGFIGSGNIGSTVAGLAVAAGYDVVLSNSRGPETLAEVVDQLGPRARAATASDAAAVGDIVVVTVPLRAYREVPVEPLGRV